jgi:hypothetical protein
MIGTASERSLQAAIIPPGWTWVHAISGMAFTQGDLDERLISHTKNNLSAFLSGCYAALSYDYAIRSQGKANLFFSALSTLPIPTCHLDPEIICRSLLLNCLTRDYAILWQDCWDAAFKEFSWSRQDARLDDKVFSTLTNVWSWETPLRSDYARRQALVELDVLVAMALGLSLDQLIIVYRLDFAVLQKYETDTWYDQNGRIVFTNNRSLTNVGYPRPEWEQIKDAPSGTFTRTITDDTQPGGAVERTIEYVAPFYRCDREQDYETAWAFFEEKYK